MDGLLSVPSQTWPNRGFVHSGSSDGRVNNDSYEFYHNATIFNVLQAQGIPWKIFFRHLYCVSERTFSFGNMVVCAITCIGTPAFKMRVRLHADSDPEDKLPKYSFT
jgi:phospholipase C